jgi:nucleoside phosphorylase
MSHRGLLTDAHLRDVQDAAVSARLDRNVLLTSLGPGLVASLPKAPSPGEQLLSDLRELNRIGKLRDDSIPLRSWLETAKHLAGPRREAAVFEAALAALAEALAVTADALAPTAEALPANAPPARAAAPQVPATAPPRPPRDPKDAPVDILLVTVLPEEYGAVLRLLSNPAPVQGKPDAPTLYGWRTGTIPRAQGGAYRVVLAMTGQAGTVRSSQAVVRSVERWKPRYVLLVGIAGGLPPSGCSLGDAVVSTHLYGYEYGKIDSSGFQPRLDFIYQVDQSLCTSAQAFVAATPDWHSGSGAAPRVAFGPVASGDKVVDDPAEPFFAAVIKQWPKLHAVEMEGAGAAAAIEELRAAGNVVGFLMVRGLSDLPRPAAERAGAATQTGERDTNKRRACDVAASFAVRWIAAEWPVEPRDAENPP